MFGYLICALFSHQPKKSLARYDDGMFRAPCRRCGSAMIRDQAGWRLAEGVGADRRRRRLARASIVVVAVVALAGALIAPHAVLKPPAAGTSQPTG